MGHAAEDWSKWLGQRFQLAVSAGLVLVAQRSQDRVLDLPWRYQYQFAAGRDGRPLRPVEADPSDDRASVVWVLRSVQRDLVLGQDDGSAAGGGPFHLDVETLLSAATVKVV